MDEEALSRWLKNSLSVETHVEVCCGELIVTTTLLFNGVKFSDSDYKVTLPNDKDDRY